MNLSPIFINLSDAMAAIKANDTPKAKDTLVQIETAFDAINATAKIPRLGYRQVKRLGKPSATPQKPIYQPCQMRYMPLKKNKIL
ncbi:MAG: hypothetical protein U1E91_06425 [Moraxella sp.]